MSDGRFLIFEIGGGKYAMAISDVAEIMERPAVYPVPKAPPYYLGLIDVHNRPVPLVDLAMKNGNASSGTCGEVLVLGGKNVNVALLVDRVVDISAGVFGREIPADGKSSEAQKLMYGGAAVEVLDPESLVEMLEKEMNS